MPQMVGLEMDPADLPPDMLPAAPETPAVEPVAPPVAGSSNR
jgi:hypothetical protein